MPGTANTGGGVPPRRSTASGIATVPTDASGDPIRRALAAIDRVHLTPNAATMLIRRDILADGAEGLYDPRAGDIVIDPDATAPELATVHEFGHFLDHRIVGSTGSLGRARWGSEHAAELVDWRTAVAASQAATRLRLMLATVPSPDAADYIRYLLRLRELWARAYEHYIATRSADPILLAHIDAVRSRPPTRGISRLDYYWSDADFAPIAAEIDKIIAAREWSR